MDPKGALKPGFDIVHWAKYVHKPAGSFSMDWKWKLRGAEIPPHRHGTQFDEYARGFCDGGTHDI